MKEIKRKKLAVALVQAMGTGIAVSVFATGAIAQQAQKIERIEVTGSNIKRVDTETVAPVQIIGRDDIEKSAKSSVADLIRDLPANTGNSFNETFTNSFSPGASGVSLRGLGQKATLVLINGRRMANYGFAQNLQDTFVDLNSIPSSAVDRIEILKDGASAVYGSDAIGGVVNIVLRRDYKGGEITGNAGTSTEGGLNEYKGALTFGWGDLGKDKYNVLAVLDYFHRDELKFDERDYTKDSDYRGYPGGTFAWSGTAGTWNRGGVARQALDGCTQRGLTVFPANQFVAGRTGTACGFNIAPYLSHFPESDRLGALVKGSFDITPSLSAFGEFMFSNTETKQSFTPAFVETVAYNPATGGISQITNRLPASHPNNPFGTTTRLDYAFMEVGGRDAKIESDSYRFLAGLKGNVGAWDWEGALITARNEVKQDNLNRVDRYAFVAMRDNQTYNFASPQTDLVNQLRINPTRESTSKLEGGDIKVTSELAQMAAGPLGFAAGIEYRKESIQDVPDALLLSGAVLGQGSTRTDGSRNLTAGYFELSIPAAKGLEIQIAGRQDKYSDFGSAFSPKGGFKWTPTSEVLIRGSASRGFRAPTLPEISPSSATFFTTIFDPDFGFAGFNVAGVFNSNPNLKPERSNNYTLGIVFEPSRDFNVGFDFYNIKQKNVVNANSFQYIVENPDLFPGQIIRDPTTGFVIYITEQFRNLAFVETSGVDISLAKTFNMGAYGKSGIRIDYNYLAHWRTQVAADAPIEDYVDQNGFSEFPRYRGTVTFDWTKGAWASAFTYRYLHSYDNVFASGSQPKRIGAWYGLDLFASYNYSKNLKFTGSIRNLLDRDPSYDPNYTARTAFTLYDLRGRYVNIGAAYTFK